MSARWLTIAATVAVLSGAQTLGVWQTLTRALGSPWDMALAESSEYDADVGLDPGHSRADVGAAGAGLREYELTMDVALRAQERLREQGLKAVLSRGGSGPVSSFDNRDYLERVRLEQEARIAAVGRVRAYVSIHFNGHSTPAIRGTETYFNRDNQGGESLALAEALHSHLLSELRDAGYKPTDRGVKEDLLAGKPYGHFYSLRGDMPSALVEALFLSNPEEASYLTNEDALEAIAVGLAQGVAEFLSEP